MSRELESELVDEPTIVVHITTEGMLEAEWTVVRLYADDVVLSERTVYGLFQRSRARRVGRKLRRDAEDGILWG